MRSGGMVAAGHPLTAAAGARVLRNGGNAVDAAVGAMLTSWVAEPLLSGPGAGGYMLVAGAGEDPVLLDFFVSAPGSGFTGTHEPLLPVGASFGDATQVFNVGPAAVGVPGNPVGVVRALERWGTVPLAELCAPAAALARTGVRVNAQQAYIFKILSAIFFSTPEARALFAEQGRSIREGDWFVSAELGDCIERLGAEGPAPFYTGDVARALVAWVGERGGALTMDDLAAYDAEAREPVRASYRERRDHHPAAVGRRHPARAGDGAPRRDARPARRR